MGYRIQRADYPKQMLEILPTGKSGPMMISDWKFWTIIAVLLITTYVQLVGKHVEFISHWDRVLADE
ncbi:MAG: hypothetical protein ABSG25_07730 [Bryobacteraceae bacterium]